VTFDFDELILFKKVISHQQKKCPDYSININRFWDILRSIFKIKINSVVIFLFLFEGFKGFIQNSLKFQGG